MNDDGLMLQAVYRHERQWADALHMTQPMGNGVVERFSWARTVGEARRLAAYIRSLGLPPQSQIAIVTKNCAEFIITDIAIWMTGNVSVAIYPTLNAETVRFILEHSDAKLVFVGKLDEYEQIDQGIGGTLPRVTYPLAPKGAAGKSWKSIQKEYEPIPDSPTPRADDMALIIYTSGSTGMPKGVMHSFRAISEAGHGGLAMLNITRADRMLSYLPIAHVMERWASETLSLLSGMELYFAESIDSFLQDLQRAKPTIFASVPRLWLKFQLGVFKKLPPKKLDLFLKIPILSGVIKKKVLSGLGLDHVRFAGSGSAPIPGELIQWYRDLGLELQEGYGMTETFSYSHLSLPGKSRVGYVGNVNPGVECRLTDEGEVLVKSPGNMLGYFKEPELSKQSFTEDGFIKTGDRGEVDSRGRLRITGRVKELFKTSKGKYVAPVPIENLINNCPVVELSCVFGSGHEAASGVVNLAEDLHKKIGDPAVRAETTRTLEALLKDVNCKVEEFEQLQFLIVAKEPWTIAGGKLTPSMKIKRPTIEAAYAPRLAEWYASGKAVIWE
jgi:long-chain acyl-CoA synthetase